MLSEAVSWCLSTHIGPQQAIFLALLKASAIQFAATAHRPHLARRAATHLARHTAALGPKAMLGPLHDFIQSFLASEPIPLILTLDDLAIQKGQTHFVPRLMTKKSTEEHKSSRLKPMLPIPLVSIGSQEDVTTLSEVQKKEDAICEECAVSLGGRNCCFCVVYKIKKDGDGVATSNPLREFTEHPTKRGVGNARNSTDVSLFLRSTK